jgi:hypothetical protein
LSVLAFHLRSTLLDVGVAVRPVGVDGGVASLLFPWQLVDPESVNVLPGSGTNSQS